MLTKKELLKILEMYNDDAVITNEQNQNFIHAVSTYDGNMILSTTKPIGYCNRTDGYVYPTVVSGYAGFCPTTDEDLYEFEFTPLNSENEIKNI